MDSPTSKLTTAKGPLSASESLRRTGRGQSNSPADLQRSAQTLARCSSPEARRLLPYEHARRLGVLPLGIVSVLGESTLSLAAPPRFPQDRIAELRFCTGHQIKIVPTPFDVLQQAMHAAYLGSEDCLLEKIEAVRSVEKLSGAPDISRPQLRVAQGDVAQLLTALVDYAISREASDIHVLPLRDGGYVKLRVHGELLSHGGSYCSLESHGKLIARLKVLAGLDTTQRAVPQDGSFTVPVQSREVFIRLSIMPTIHGEKAVIRLMNPSHTRTLNTLGLPDQVLDLLDKYSSRNEGAILFAGPTGSGKSTTMYGLLSELAAKNLSISTIEDPVETQIEGISQTSIDEKRGLSYAACLRSVLRQDPDVILLGEMRDEESARIALQAAVTGHILLSTVHARNCLEVFTRLRALGADMLTVAQATGLLICQRLLPSLCAKCKVVDLQHTAQMMGQDVYRAVGCAHCDYSGFDGCALALEALEMHSELYQAIVHGELKALQPQGLDQKFYLPMRRGLEKLLEEGTIQFGDYLASV